MKSLRICLLEADKRLAGLAYGGRSLASQRGWDSYLSPEERKERDRFKRGKDRLVVDRHWGRLDFIELDGKKFRTHQKAIEYLATQGFDEESAGDMLKQLPTEYAVE